MMRKKFETIIRRARKMWPYMLLLVSCVLFLTAGIILLSAWHSYREQTKTDARLNAVREKTYAAMLWGGQQTDPAEALESEPDVKTDPKGGETRKERRLRVARESFDTLRAMNFDYVGWLAVDGTPVSYPVVFGRHDYYLTHDFFGEKNRHGSVFLDEACGGEIPVWIIHGHHMRDGTMFGGLKKMEDEAYVKSHRTLRYDAGEGEERYRIYAVALADRSETAEGGAEAGFHYEVLPGADGESLADWQQGLRSISIWYADDCETLLKEAGEDPGAREVILLSTCEYKTPDQRLIVAAVRER